MANNSNYNTSSRPSSVPASAIPIRIGPPTSNMQGGMTLPQPKTTNKNYASNNRNTTNPRQSPAYSNNNSNSRLPPTSAQTAVPIISPASSQPQAHANATYLLQQQFLRQQALRQAQLNQSNNPANRILAAGITNIYNTSSNNLQSNPPPIRSTSATVPLTSGGRPYSASMLTDSGSETDSTVFDDGRNGRHDSNKALEMMAFGKGSLRSTRTHTQTEREREREREKRRKSMGEPERCIHSCIHSWMVF